MINPANIYFSEELIPRFGKVWDYGFENGISELKYIGFSLI
jgi:hypothetical protein